MNMYVGKIRLSSVTILALLSFTFNGVAIAATPAASEGTKTTNGTPRTTGELFPDTVVARAKGVEIKRSQLDRELVRLKAQAANAGQRIPPEHASMLESRVLEQIVQLQLLNNRATDADKVLGRETAEKRLADARSRLGSEELFNARLKAESLTSEDLLARWTEAATADSVIKREIKVDVSDADVAKFYSDNPARFEQPEMVRASHILFSTVDEQRKDLPEQKKAEKRKLAEQVLKRVRAGEDFAALAKQFSEDPGSKDRGGEYRFPRGQMVPEFEATAFSLATNQVSDLVTTQFGYHIIKLHEKIPAKKVELDKIRPELKEALVSQEIQKQLPAYVKKLEQDAGLEILDPALKVAPPMPGLGGAPSASGLPAGHPPVTPPPPAKK
jgi:peptidyl-prolyl cis-trans isomerase C